MSTSNNRQMPTFASNCFQLRNTHFKLRPKINFAAELMLGAIVNQYEVCMVWVKCCCIVLQRIFWLVMCRPAALQLTQQM